MFWKVVASLCRERTIVTTFLLFLHNCFIFISLSFHIGDIIYDNKSWFFDKILWKNQVKNVENVEKFKLFC